MELSQLEAFERVAREGSFTRAAEALDLTQPAISMRIAALEAEVGGHVFERRGRHLHLTPLGDMLMPYALRMLAVRADSLQAMRSFHRGQVGEVKLAAPTPFVLSFLVETLEDFRHAHPTADILIRERNKTTIFEMLHDNVITLGLVNAPVFDRRLVELARLRDPIRAVVAATHPLAKMAENVPMESVFEHTIFRVSMFPEMTAFMDSIVEQGRKGSGGAVIAIPMVMASRLTLKGQGVTFLPESYIREYLDSGALVILNLPEMPTLHSQPVLIALRDRKLDVLHQAFVKLFKGRWRGLAVE
jgi:DNA-binding transcriptional LysR family regulator